MLKLAFPYFYNSKKIATKINTLSNIIEDNNIKKIDVLKIDAENYELQILNGIETDHWKIIQNIIVEIHGNVENGRAIKSEIIKILSLIHI